MKAIILKPVVWNTKNYIEPSGHKATSGFAKDYGYGHEEWNNSPSNLWRGQRIFHTEATDKLLEYSGTSELGIISIASHNNVQYALGIATNVVHNSKDEMILISKELNFIERGTDLWNLPSVKKCFEDNHNRFLAHWKRNYQWIRWRCPVNHFHWFNAPIPLSPKNITGKEKLTSMHGRFQAITPFIALDIIKNHIPKGHGSPIWLTDGEFDEEINKKIPQNKKTSAQKLRKKFKIKANAPAQNSFEYWVAGNRTVNPHHATLQAKFISHLHKKKIQPSENQNYIDVQYVKDRNLHFAEIKPTETVESKYAIRAAIGQLLEYRYTSEKDPLLEIVIGSKPKTDEINFVKSVGMIITYYDKKTKSFISKAP